MRRATVPRLDGAPTHSTLGRPLAAEELGPAGAPCRALLFAGIHGDEPGSVDALDAFAARLAAAPDGATRFVLARAVNPDGLAAGAKDSARGVDLNRNFDAKSWTPSHRPGYFPGDAPLSEPESAWLAALVEWARPSLIVSLHQPFRCVNYDGPARDLAERMAAACGWPVVADIGYPTPGSFGARYGFDAGLPVITLELPRPLDAHDLERAVAALTAACAE